MIDRRKKRLLDTKVKSHKMNFKIISFCALSILCANDLMPVVSSALSVGSLHPLGPAFLLTHICAWTVLKAYRQAGRLPFWETLLESHGAIAGSSEHGHGVSRKHTVGAPAIGHDLTLAWNFAEAFFQLG